MTFILAALALLPLIVLCRDDSVLPLTRQTAFDPNAARRSGAVAGLPSWPLPGLGVRREDAAQATMCLAFANVLTH